MNRDGIESLMDRWMNEPAFRAGMRANPEAVAKASGVELTEDELAALKGIDFRLSDEELQARVSKMA
ncbi:MAG TPA: Os1348 family NHLP clan protein [Chthonomonadaceae bacterium]|nr:Os1348 family NHLP clan protein [Chthonomonadaceae bacterium]